MIKYDRWIHRYNTDPTIVQALNPRGERLENNLQGAGSLIYQVVAELQVAFQMDWVALALARSGFPVWMKNQIDIGKKCVKWEN